MKKYKDVVKKMLDNNDIDFKNIEYIDCYLKDEETMKCLFELCESIEKISSKDFGFSDRRFLIISLLHAYNDGYVPGLVSFFNMLFISFDKHCVEFRDICTENFYEELKFNTEIADVTIDEDLRIINILIQEEFSRDYFYNKFRIGFYDATIIGLDKKYEDVEIFTLEPDDLKDFIIYYHNSTFSPYLYNTAFDYNTLYENTLKHMNTKALKFGCNLDELDVLELYSLSIDTLEFIRENSDKYIR